MAKMISAVLPVIFIVFELLFSISSFLSIERSAFLCLTMMLWMVIWWVLEILPLGITALLPIIFVPLAGILPLKEITALYANPVIYLFLGGFIIARALEKTQLSHRIALRILKATGSSDRGVILGFILATTLMSMWISNTATAVMMVPIAMAVMTFLSENLNSEESKGLDAMSVVLFLSIAYSANVGGIITPVGTPPNVVLMGFLDELYGIDVDFWKWSLVGAPVAFTLLVLQALLLFWLFPFRVDIGGAFSDFVQKKLNDLGELSQRQKVTIYIFSLTASLWVFKGLIHWAIGMKVFNDTSIAILGGLLLFLVPTKKGEHSPVLEQGDIAFLPWNIVLLFGGGMALAGSLKHVGLIELTTESLGSLGIASPYLLVFILAAVSLFLTEVMSNVALCVVALPVMMQLGTQLGMNPLMIGIPVAFCSSFAFSMPISTPPNAIVFGTGKVKVSEMLRAGVVLNLVGLAAVMLVGWAMMSLIL